MHGGGAGGDRLGQIAGELDAAIGDDRNIGRLGRFDRRHDGGELRHADAGDDAGGADRARTDTDLDRIRTGIDQRLGAIGGGDVAGHDAHRVRHLLDAGDRIENALRMAMRGIDDEQVDAGFDQPLGPLEAIVADADGGRGTQAALRILGGIRVELRLLDVLDGDQADAAAVAIDDQQLFDAVRVQQALGFLLIDVFLDRDRGFPGSSVRRSSGPGRRRSGRRGW